MLHCMCVYFGTDCGLTNGDRVPRNFTGEWTGQVSLFAFSNFVCHGTLLNNRFVLYNNQYYGYAAYLFMLGSMCCGNWWWLRIRVLVFQSYGRTTRRVNLIHSH